MKIQFLILFLSIKVFFVVGALLSLSTHSINWQMSRFLWTSAASQPNGFFQVVDSAKRLISVPLKGLCRIQWDSTWWSLDRGDPSGQHPKRWEKTSPRSRSELSWKSIKGGSYTRVSQKQSLEERRQKGSKAARQDSKCTNFEAAVRVGPTVK